MPAICFEWKRPITSHGGSLTSEASIYIKLKKKKKAQTGAGMPFATLVCCGRL